MTPVEREPLREKVRKILMDYILDGELEPGSDINEQDLADQLGVSRTPLRETLLRLTYDQFLIAKQGRGFSVAPLDEETMAELFVIISRLEALALSSSASGNQEQINRLRKIDEKRRVAMDTPYEWLTLDDEWHECLVSECGNESLVNLIGRLRPRLFRYRYHFAHSSKGTELALQQHAEIVDALEAGESEEAVQLLLDHWDTGLESVPTIVKSRPGATGLSTGET